MLRSIAKFQFHLVRLKAETVREVDGGLRKFQFHLVRLKDLGYGLFYPYIVFQFHLVRLKEDDNRRHGQGHAISIPLFSTIKSCDSATVEACDRDFNSI